MLRNSLEAVVTGEHEHEVRVDQESMERGWGAAQGQEFEFS